MQNLFSLWGIAGRMAEWSNAPDSKSGIRFSRIEGSNPSLSAIVSMKTPREGRFHFLPHIPPPTHTSARPDFRGLTDPRAIWRSLADCGALFLIFAAPACWLTGGLNPDDLPWVRAVALSPDLFRSDRKSVV